MSYVLHYGHLHIGKLNTHKFSFTFPKSVVKTLYLVNSLDNWKTPIAFTSSQNIHNDDYLVWNLTFISPPVICFEYKYMFETPNGDIKWFDKVQYAKSKDGDTFTLNDTPFKNISVSNNISYGYGYAVLTSKINYNVYHVLGAPGYYNRPDSNGYSKNYITWTNPGAFKKYHDYDNIEAIICSGGLHFLKNQPIVFPNNLKHIEIHNSFKDILKLLPISVEHIVFAAPTIEILEENVLPIKLKSITFNCGVEIKEKAIPVSVKRIEMNNLNKSYCLKMEKQIFMSLDYKLYECYVNESIIPHQHIYTKMSDELIIEI